MFDITGITYETLANDKWTDHVRAFRLLFEIEKISSFLEFGAGKGTKYFLDQCERVTSYEISLPSRDMLPWYNACLIAYKEYANWTPKHATASNVFDYYNKIEALGYYAQKLQYCPRFLPEFESEVKAICDDALKERHYDVAFVDPGILTRADFINCLFDRVDIIVAHDIRDLIYGWPRVYDHPDYESIRFLHGTEVGFWIKKSRATLIKNLKAKMRSC